VDNKLQEFTVSVTGKAPEIKLWAPGQGKISVSGKAPEIKLWAPGQGKIPQFYIRSFTTDRYLTLSWSPQFYIRSFTPLTDKDKVRYLSVVKLLI
jgi:hypothetical protein